MLEAVSRWEQNIYGLFNLVALEIWGRMFVMRRPLEELSHEIQYVSDKRGRS
jgi:hypothetical protein